MSQDPYEDLNDRLCRDTSRFGELLTPADEPLEDEMLCVVCGHEPAMHDDKYGCQVERGDMWVPGEKIGGWMAMGPCGCKHWRTPDERLKQWLEVAYARYMLESTRNLVDHIYGGSPLTYRREPIDCTFEELP